jgi:HlyD family secretion protein
MDASMLQPTTTSEPGSAAPTSAPAPILRAIRDTAATDVVVEPSRPNRRRIILAAAAAVVGIAGIAAVRAWMTTGVGIPRDRVRIAEVTRGIFVRDVAAEGTVVAANSPTLYAVATGTITFSARAGERVAKGQTLGLLDSPSLVNEYQREQATLDSLDVDLGRQEIEDRRQELKNREDIDQASVQMQAAQREFKRAEKARQDGVIPERDFAKARDDVQSAQLAFDHAKANARLETDSMQFELRTKRLERDRQKLVVANLARRVAELTIRSPVDGMVGSLAVNQKTTVAENAALLTVVDLSALEIEFRVPESYATEIAPDMKSEIAYGAKTYSGQVTTVSPEVKDHEVSGRLKFADSVAVGLRQNQRVNVRIIMDSRKDVVKVERGAFVDSGGTIYVIDGAMARRRTARLGAMSVGEVEILSGATPGEQIVISSLSDFNDAPEVRLGN